ncbi:TIGR01777 family oxidoreductase [Paenibacillus sp. sptzw28]|uniref:TIGR01777 family oxidoreductase n=1 Tax=Paenibacillus sp. sptzw28 TaxID=715179 RepID=UPI001C6F0C78|nr:TIGR01777 family oxidoreductase [Paenibacillus sp. sptzw28]QYR20668.1 TIGR01777 family oxidoreductase [Paenibacillus sp. sptzw28]
MKVAVTGGTGFVGGKLVDALLKRGDEVWIISRTPGRLSNESKNLRRVTWNELEASPGLLGNLDAIVNLAGESINQRWTEDAKVRILQSRLDATEHIERIIAKMEKKPDVVINASGISIYGTSQEAVFDENSPPDVTDFLSGVVEKWEEAADRIDVPRLVKLRVGIVLGRKGGAFPLMAMPYRFFVGGKVGSGKQWLSWIHIEDMTRLLLFCLDDPNISGPVNAAAPEPVTNDAFGRVLGAALRRPHWFPVPAVMLNILFGELSLLLLEGQRALPRKALSHGFEFRYPTISSAMKDLVGRG